MTKILKMILLVLTLFTVTSCSASIEAEVSNLKVYKYNKTTNYHELKLNEKEELLVVVMDLTNESDENWEDDSSNSNESHLNLNKNTYPSIEKNDDKAIYQFVENCGYYNMYTFKQLYAGESKKVITTFKVNENDLEDTDGSIYIDFNDQKFKSNFAVETIKEIDILDQVLIEISGEGYHALRSIPMRANLYMSIMKASQLAYENIRIEQLYGSAPSGESGFTMLNKTKELWNESKEKGISLIIPDQKIFQSFDSIPLFNIELIKKENAYIAEQLQKFDNNMDKIFNLSSDATVAYNENIEIIIEMSNFNIK